MLMITVFIAQIILKLGQDPEKVQLKYMWHVYDVMKKEECHWTENALMWNRMTTYFSI